MLSWHSLSSASFCIASDGAIWGDEFHHGTPLRHALAEELVAPGQLHQIGLRGPWGGAGDGDVSAEHGARLHPAEEVADRGIAAVMGEVLHAVGERPLYLSFDVDAAGSALRAKSQTAMTAAPNSASPSVRISRHREHRYRGIVSTGTAAS